MENEISNAKKTNFEEFKVSLSSIDYEGPLSILFDMLKRSEKNIYEVSILEIIDQFIEYLKKQAALNLNYTEIFCLSLLSFIYINRKCCFRMIWTKINLPTD